MLTSTLGWVLALAATVTAAPQAWRILRHRTTTGVSTTTCALGVGTMSAWSWFTASIGDLPALGSSLGPLLCWSVCVYGLYRYGPGRRALALTAGVELVVLLVCFAGFASSLAVAGSLSWALPQAIAAVRGADLSGVSATAYLLIAVENAAWVLYALLTGTWEYAVAPLVQGPTSLLIARRAIRSHRIVSSDAVHGRTAAVPEESERARDQVKNV
jgi:uncharacterized protein with PQ loop repeat